MTTVDQFLKDFPYTSQIIFINKQKNKSKTYDRYHQLFGKSIESLYDANFDILNNEYKGYIKLISLNSKNHMTTNAMSSNVMVEFIVNFGRKIGYECNVIIRNTTENDVEDFYCDELSTDYEIKDCIILLKHILHLNDNVVSFKIDKIEATDDEHLNKLLFEKKCYPFDMANTDAFYNMFSKLYDRENFTMNKKDFDKKNVYDIKCYIWFSGQIKNENYITKKRKCVKN